MVKVRVMAVARQGFNGFFRAGRFWASGQFTEAEVDDKQLEQLQAEAAKKSPMLVVEELDAKGNPKRPKADKPEGG